MSDDDDVDWALEAAADAAPKDLEPLRALIAAGRDVDRPGYHGRTPLCDLVWSGCVPAVELLLAAGADPNAVERHGLSVLTHALHTGIQGRPTVHQTVALILEAGANPNGHGPEPGPPRPLALAMLQDERAMAERLLAAGADPLAVDAHGRSVHALAILAGREPFIALFGGAEAVAAARPRIPDPEVAALKAEILRRLKAAGHKFSVVNGGFKYEYDDPTEVIWDDGQWVRVAEDGYNQSRSVQRGFVPDDEALIAYLLRERGGWAGRAVPRDQLHEVLRFVVPRGAGDLPLKAKPGRR